jgi:hypothetical protein
MTKLHWLTLWEQDERPTLTVREACGLLQYASPTTLYKHIGEGHIVTIPDAGTKVVTRTVYLHRARCIDLALEKLGAE